MWLVINGTLMTRMQAPRIYTDFFISTGLKLNTDDTDTSNTHIHRFFYIDWLKNEHG